MKDRGRAPAIEGLRALRGTAKVATLLAFDYFFPVGRGAMERLAALAAELVSLRPDVIFTFTTARGLNAAAGATSTIPIVVGPAGEQTFRAACRQLQRPIGNVTGVTLSSVGQAEKCLQLLKELSPRTSRVAVMLNPDNPNFQSHPGETWLQQPANWASL